ncbi:MAG: DMT family transporter [Chitinophagaceae bacterium]|nr:DMT family transporter [Chitinophagaceae bacterium]
MMTIPSRYKGIIYMLLAALGFSLMGGAAKLLKGSFGAGQLVFWRNAIGLLVLLAGFLVKPPENKGGRFHLLLFRGIMGTTALYTLLYCILHIPLGTAMTYNLTSALFIAVFSFLLFREYHGRVVLFAVLLGFAGMLLIYKPAMHFPWYYHLAGLISGITSALAYITVNRLAGHYDSRIIVLSFIGTGVLIPSLLMCIRSIANLPADDVFFIAWRWPQGIEWFYVCWLGLAALFGQYFVTKAYGADKAGIVSSIGYANIIFSVFIGMALGDAFPDWMSASGILCIIASGVIISLTKRKKKVTL